MTLPIAPLRYLVLALTALLTACNESEPVAPGAGAPPPAVAVVPAVQEDITPPRWPRGSSSCCSKPQACRT